MKIWHGYGSEHSANLIMIGRFNEIKDAKKAKEIIDEITEQVRSDEQAGLMNIGEKSDHYTDGMLNLLSKLNIGSIESFELEQFVYDITTKVENNQIMITTDEIDVSAFFKVLINKGARVEVYSGHDYPITGDVDVQKG